MRVPKDYRPVVRRAMRQGWTLRATGSGHFKLTDPQSKRVIVFAATPGGGRALQNFRARARREGVRV